MFKSLQLSVTFERCVYCCCEMKEMGGAVIGLCVRTYMSGQAKCIDSYPLNRVPIQFQLHCSSICTVTHYVVFLVFVCVCVCVCVSVLFSLPVQASTVLWLKVDPVTTHRQLSAPHQDLLNSTSPPPLCLPSPPPPSPLPCPYPRSPRIAPFSSA